MADKRMNDYLLLLVKNKKEKDDNVGVKQKNFDMIKFYIKNFKL